MVDRGDIKLRHGISDTQFEEMIKQIDAHFSHNGLDIHHPLIRGMVDDTDSLKNLTNFFVHIYAAGNTMANVRNRAVHNVSLRIRARTARAAAASAALRRAVPRAAANEGVRRARERTARSATRTIGRAVARAAANASRARLTRRSRSSSRNRSTIV
jgi:hypothetical protein